MQLYLGVDNLLKSKLVENFSIGSFSLGQVRLVQHIVFLFFLKMHSLDGFSFFDHLFFDECVHLRPHTLHNVVEK